MRSWARLFIGLPLIGKLKDLSSSCGCVILDDTPDNCPAMMRLKHAVQKRVEDTPNILYEENDGCITHWLNLYISKTLGERDFVGHVHAIQTVENVYNQRLKLHGAIAHIVNAELEIFPGAPPQEYVEHTEAIITNTITRKVALVRAHCNDQGAGRYQTLIEAAKPVKVMANGDIRRHVCSHYCSGRCCKPAPGVSLRTTQVQNFLAAMLGSGMFGGVDSSIAAVSRWLSATMGCSLQFGGVAFFGLLPRGWRLAFGEWSVPQGMDNLDDFAKMIRSKTYRGKLWLLSEFIDIKQGVFVFCSTPAEHLMQTLQTLDAAGSPLRAVTSLCGNPILECLTTYSSMLLRLGT